MIEVYVCLLGMLALMWVQVRRERAADEQVLTDVRRAAARRVLDLNRDLEELRGRNLELIERLELAHRRIRGGQGLGQAGKPAPQGPAEAGTTCGQVGCFSA